ncbi:hypothetical protein GCM10027614_02320 [Micromonospora vulcania]
MHVAEHALPRVQVGGGEGDGVLEVVARKPSWQSVPTCRHTGTVDSPGGTDHQIPPGRVSAGSGGV